MDILNDDLRNEVKWPFMISAKLGLGNGSFVPCQLLIDDSHCVHLAHIESCNLEIHHDKISFIGSGQLSLIQ